MSPTPIEINNSYYDIQQKFVDLSSRYFNIENSNLLKAGLFGYINEIMSSSLQDSAYHKNALYKEFFLNTASLPESIYNFAKKYNLEIQNASPAKMSVNFSIKKKHITDIMNNNPNNEFFIRKDNKFVVENFNYRLQHDVKITGQPVTDQFGTIVDYSLTAQYLINNQDIIIEEMSTPYIKTWIEMYQGEKFVFMSLDVFQMEEVEKRYITYTDDIAENIFYDFNYEDQLAEFKVLYKSNYMSKDTTAINLKKYFDISELEENTAPHFFYTYPRENNLRIFFSGDIGSFSPRYNSEIILKLYTTKGARGNFNYTGEILFKFQEEEYSDIQVVANAITDSSGGVNRPTLKELKERIKEHILVGENIITEMDLDIFFNSIVNRDIINDSQLKFLKKVDDIMRRVFSVYILLKDSKSRVIPTNTVDVTMELSQLENMDFTIKPGTIVIYDTSIEGFRLLAEDEYPEDYIDREGIIMYSIPFLMDIRLDPFPRVIYSKNTINDDVDMKYNNVNPSVNYEFLVHKMNIDRNSILEDFYNFNFNLATNLPKEEVIDNLKARCILKKDNVVYGYFDLELSDLEEYEFSAKLKTDDTFNTETNGFNIINSVRDIMTGSLIDSVYVNEEIDMELALLYNGVTDKTKYGNFSDMGDIDSYCTAVLFDNDESVNLFKTMSGVISSDFVVTDTGVFNVKAIPCISTFYFSNYEKYNEFYKLIDIYEKTISREMSRLENNTSINLKFFNTYGISKYYSVDTTNIRVNLAIKAISGYSPALDKEIKEYIIGFIENSNENGIVSISNMLSSLETSFEEIEYIEFKDINGINLQKINDLYPNFRGLNKEQIINYVPEYINVSMKRTDFSTSSDFNPNIEIKYL